MIPRIFHIFFCLTQKFISHGWLMMLHFFLFFFLFVWFESSSCHSHTHTHIINTYIYINQNGSILYCIYLYIIYVMNLGWTKWLLVVCSNGVPYHYISFWYSFEYQSIFIFWQPIYSLFTFSFLSIRISS